jgi:hypothetical protein
MLRKIADAVIGTAVIRHGRSDVQATPGVISRASRQAAPFNFRFPFAANSMPPQG